MIFKVQKPLGGDLRRALIYNEDRSITFTLDMDDGLDSLFAEHGPRVFVEGEVSQLALGICISKIVPDPGW